MAENVKKRNIKWRVVVENLDVTEMVELMASLLEAGFVQGYAEEIEVLESGRER